VERVGAFFQPRSQAHATIQPQPNQTHPCVLYRFLVRELRDSGAVIARLSTEIYSMLLLFRTPLKSCQVSLPGLDPTSHGSRYCDDILYNLSVNIYRFDFLYNRFAHSSYLKN
jgi:hypothetical protein